MKRIIIIVLLVLAIFGAYFLVVKGLNIGENFSISNYEEIESLSDSLTKSVAAYNKKNTTEYTSALTTLNSSITKYEAAKEEYEELIAELGTEEETIDEETDEIIVSTSLPLYEIDFLWATVGNYAKSEGLTITMNVTKAATSSLGYDTYNLSFNVTGEYINIANFLYDLEDDDQLSFEIRDFSMTSKNATFTVYNVPINSETLLETTVTTETTDETDSETTDDANTVGNETITSNTSDSNTTNNTANTNNTTNSSNTSNTSNTTNTTNNTTN